MCFRNTEAKGKKFSTVGLLKGVRGRGKAEEHAREKQQA